MNSYLLAVLTNPRAGQETAFNSWYSDRHLPDVLALPGVTRAQRYELAPVQHRSDPPPFGYLALYQIETDDLPALLAELAARHNTDRMPISDALDDVRLTLLFQPLGPPQEARDAP